jgi:hypothetical protein
MSVEFKLVLEDSGLVLVEFPHHLGAFMSEPYQQLATALEVIACVQAVEVLRFSAFLYLHPDRAVSVALAEIAEALLHNPQIREVLTAAGVTDYGVAFSTC